jgi:hypothetical protein
MGAVKIEVPNQYAEAIALAEAFGRSEGSPSLRGVESS